MTTVQILGKIEKAFGPSGFENGIRNEIKKQANSLGYKCKVDTLGNLICHKEGKGPKIMFAAHMDTLGFMACNIDDNGYVKFSKIGGLSPEDLVATPVVFANGTKGVVQRPDGVEAKDLTIDKLFIDLGVSSKKEAEELVSLGDVAVFDTPVITSKDGKYITGPYMDDRTGCAVQLKAMELAAKSTNDLYFVFTVQEEVGLRGAQTAVFDVDPDYAIITDVTDAKNVPGGSKYTTAIGKGPSVLVRDSSIISHVDVVKMLEDDAKKAKIKTQRDVCIVGGTDAGPVHLSRGGVPTSGVCIPLKYMHSPMETVCASDLEECAQLVAAFANRKF